MFAVPSHFSTVSYFNKYAFAFNISPVSQNLSKPELGYTVVENFLIFLLESPSQPDFVRLHAGGAGVLEL